MLILALGIKSNFFRFIAHSTLVGKVLVKLYVISENALLENDLSVFGGVPSTTSTSDGNICNRVPLCHLQWLGV